MNNITVSIDLDNLFDEHWTGREESSPAMVSDLVKDAIKYEVREQLRSIVTKSVQEQVQSQTETAIKDIAEGFYRRDIEAKILDAFNTLKVKTKYASAPITVSEWVITQIDSLVTDNFNSKVKNQIELTTKVAINQLSEQYNLQFAASLIAKMKETDLLSEKGMLSLLNKGE
jgi:hypothetical protein